MSEFVEYLHEVFVRFGRISTRRMFGGHGVYHDGVMFALVADDILYLKGDRHTAELFESRGLGRFQYDKNGVRVSMSYYEAPEEIFDDEQAAAKWARLAFDAALRTRPNNGKRAKA